MTEQELVRQWERFFRDRGIPDNLVERYLGYATHLLENEVPVIFELEHLSKLLGIDYSMLCEMVNAASFFYRDFVISKKRGGKRYLSSPYPSLLSCQHWIYKNIFLKSSVHDSAHGFVNNRSIITNASVHLGQDALLKMDIKDFFGTIPINWVINYFSGLGYANNVSYYLSALCCNDGVLPQGAATSPYLSNILLYHLDERLTKLANSYGVNYTRYADDLTFSGKYVPHYFSKIVSQIVNDFGLLVNEDKTRLHTKPGQRIVTGISVSGNEPKLPRPTKRQLRKEMFFIRKYGLLSHMSKMKINNVSYLSSLEGKFVFWLQVEPNNRFAAEAVEYVKKLKAV